MDAPHTRTYKEAGRPSHGTRTYKEAGRPSHGTALRLAAAAGLGKAVGRRLSAQVFRRGAALIPGDRSLQCSVVAFDVVAFGDRRRDDDVIRHGPGLIDPDLYDAISVSLKETQARAWVHFPPGMVCPALNAWPHAVGPAAAGA